MKRARFSEEQIIGIAKTLLAYRQAPPTDSCASRRTHYAAGAASSRSDSRRTLGKFRHNHPRRKPYGFRGCDSEPVKWHHFSH